MPRFNEAPKFELPQKEKAEKEPIEFKPGQKVIAKRSDKSGGQLERGWEIDLISDKFIRVKNMAIKKAKAKLFMVLKLTGLKKLPVQKLLISKLPCFSKQFLFCSRVLKIIWSRNIIIIA